MTIGDHGGLLRPKRTVPQTGEKGTILRHWSKLSEARLLEVRVGQNQPYNPRIDKLAKVNGLDKDVYKTQARNYY